MKEKIKKFWKEHENEIMVAEAGFIGICVTYIIMRTAMNDETVVSADWCKNDEGTEFILLHLKNGISRTFVKN